MAGSKSNFLSKDAIQHYLGGVAASAPANLYVALLTVIPDDTSTGTSITETNYTSYARTQIGTSNNQTDAFNTATGTTTANVTNKNDIVFPTATGASTNPIVAIAIVTATSLGNILYWATVTSTPINNGDTAKISAGTLSVTED